ncbi:Uncharacterized protein SCF082_LOCUS13301 [Durusdinium trenchii]|uniref:Uncharacterized protein n=1 Tax=Durusdinium trenchii TaxID=1381693 RepID=A0ABP0JQL5_9DINO
MGKKHRKAVLEGIDRLNHQDALVKSSIGLKDVPVSEPPTLVITSHPRLFQELQAADGVADVFDVGVGAENLNPEEDSKIWYDVLQDYKNIVIAIGYEQSTDSLRHGKILGEWTNDTTLDDEMSVAFVGELQEEAMDDERQFDAIWDDEDRNEHGRNVRPRVAEPESERGKKVLKSIHYESDMLDRLERRALGAGELQQVMVLDARLEKWTQIQCDQHRAAVRTELTRRFEEQLALQQQQQQEQLMDSEVSVKHVTEASDESAQAAQVERSRELTAQIQRLQRVNVARLDEDAVLRHVQELSRAEADLEQIQVDLVAAASTRRPRGPPPPPPTPVAPEGAEQIRRHLEELMQREVQDLGTEEAVRHFEDIAQLHQRVQVAESAAALDSGRRELFDEGSFAVATAAPRAPWPLAMQLESPTPWPTARMRKREQILIRERRREALLVREEFEGRMRDLEQARELERERRKEMEWLVRQAEVERQQQERLAEERRRRAQELDELARTAVSQMVGRQGCARMCEKHPKFRSTSHIYLTNSQAPVSDPHRCFGGETDAIYANDSWLSTQKRIRLSDINRFLELRPYPGKPAGGKIEFPGDYNMVWGNPEWLIPEEQNYNLSFSRQQHHDMGGAAVAAVLLGDVRLAMPLEGNAEMIVWRQAVDAELRLAAQWEESWGFLKAQPQEKRKDPSVALPRLDEKGTPRAQLDEQKEHPIDSMVTPRRILATPQYSYKPRPPIEKRGTCTMSILDLHVAVSWTYSVHSKDEMTSDFPRTSSLNFSMTLSLSTV